MFFQGTVVFENSYFEQDLFETSNSYKDNIFFFQNTASSSPFF